MSDRPTITLHGKPFVLLDPPRDRSGETGGYLFMENGVVIESRDAEEFVQLVSVHLDAKGQPPPLADGGDTP